MAVASGQQPDPFDPVVAVSRAWALLADAIESTASHQIPAIHALGAANSPRATAILERIARDRSHPLRRVAIGSMPTRNVADLSAACRCAPGCRSGGPSSSDSAARLDQRPSRARAPAGRHPSGRGDTLEYAIGSARLHGPGSFEILLRAVQAGDEQSRSAAIGCVASLVAGDVPSSAENLEALRRRRPEPILTKALARSQSRYPCARGSDIGQTRYRSGADELLAVAEASDPRFGTTMSRHYAMAALHTLGRPGYLASLAASLAHVDQRVRLDAAMAMRSFASTSMNDAWTAIWQGDSPSDVRYWAFHGLIAIRGTDSAFCGPGSLTVIPASD